MAGANWRCTACDEFNGGAAKACQACETARSTPAARKPSPARPPGDWTCLKCNVNHLREDLSCLACGTGWRAATKKATPKKPPARKPAAKSPAEKTTTAKETTAAKRTTARPKATTTKRSSGGPDTPSDGRATTRGATRPKPPPAEVFYPSATAGYAPPPATPAAPPPTTPAYVPPYVPPGRPFYRTPEKTSKGKGCGLGCLGAIAVLFLLPMAASSCDGSFDSDSPGSRTQVSPTAGTCPERISEAIPSGRGAELVEAFRTKNKQITICRTSSEDLYYYGEFSDQREPGIAMRAEEIPGGYEARNDPYLYRIKGDTVTIYQNGTRIGRESLTSEPSPS
ncbi:hypothetical protein [Streptomyces sp. TE33382]